MIAKKEHYGCPLPLQFSNENDLSRQEPTDAFWYSAWMSSYCDLRAMLELSKGGRLSYSQETFRAAASRCLKDGHWKRKNLD